MDIGAWRELCTLGMVTTLCYWGMAGTVHAGHGDDAVLKFHSSLTTSFATFSAKWRTVSMPSLSFQTSPGLRPMTMFQ